MKHKTLGDWCKWLEKNFSPDIMIPTLPVIIRLDGNGFSKWTKGLKRPFDENFMDLMDDTAKFLVEETNAVISFTQSDEITLILYSDNKRSSIYNDGKKQKILSKLTGKCVNYFNERRKHYLPDHNKLANFDCRIYQTPTLHDACVQLLWRENDATKNSIQSLSQSLFSHKELQNLNGNELQNKMLTEKGVNWNNLSNRCKRGSYIRKQRVSIPFTKEELAKLPKKHDAHKNPEMVVERNVVSVYPMPIFQRIQNQVDVVFNGTAPIAAASDLFDSTLRSLRTL
jgi:tRNA(His) 5'-end guanylyltransferase